MESLLVKTGIYGFVCSLAVGILVIDTTTMVPAQTGYTSYEKDGMEYTVELLRFSIKLTIACIIVVLIYTWYKKYRKK
ncbi:hypothetical protein SAMN05192534_12628 [Alteribacillus persepolensis]|uniref:Uncharacterized protein n=1 Tax=Alteribacillus persepolensis TaxID=568899 RepID=A0A1G8IUX7_9BACI|nr:hypothetical protein [Alteribacillus persepolensis]SDI22612.1 hypothetical protein SAMN05192534_12628 [Alteribacillus persepolensis]